MFLDRPVSSCSIPGCSNKNIRGHGAPMPNQQRLARLGVGNLRSLLLTLPRQSVNFPQGQQCNGYSSTTEKRRGPRSSLARSATASRTSNHPLIRSGEVHVWWLRPNKLVSDGRLENFSRLLTKEELLECYSAAEPEVVKERVLARAFVRTVLSGYAAGAPSPTRLSFHRNAHGKPALEWPRCTEAGQQLHFNLTHTGSLIGLAVACDALVGLDVEEDMRQIREPLRLARRRFSQAEVQDLEALPEGQARGSYLMRLWTLKEAYVKAVGRGISAPPGLKSFAFRVLDQSTAEHQHRLAQPAKALRQLELGWPLCGVGAGTQPVRQGCEDDLLRCGCFDVVPGTPLGPGTPAVQDSLAAAARRESSAMGRAWHGMPLQELAGGVACSERVSQHAAACAWNSRGAGPVVASSNCSGDADKTVSSSTSGMSKVGCVKSRIEGLIEMRRSPEALRYEGNKWHFVLMRPSPNHVAALCIERPRRAAGTVTSGWMDGVDPQVVCFEGMPCGIVSSTCPEILAQGTVCD